MLYWKFLVWREGYMGALSLIQFKEISWKSFQKIRKLLNPGKRTIQPKIRAESLMEEKFSEICRRFRKMLFHSENENQKRASRKSFKPPTQFSQGCSDLVPRCMLGNHSSCFVATHPSNKFLFSERISL